MEELLTAPEVAQLLKLSRSKVYALIEQGKLPAVRIGKSVRIRPADLQIWIESMRCCSKTEG